MLMAKACLYMDNIDARLWGVLARPRFKKYPCLVRHKSSALRKIHQCRRGMNKYECGRGWGGGIPFCIFLRSWLGESPKVREKQREKWSWSGKPQRSAMALMLRLERASKGMASWNCINRHARKGGIPSSLLKTRHKCAGETLAI